MKQIEYSQGKGKTDVCNNFSRKIFCFLTVLFCYAGFAHAESTYVLVICPTGYYLSSCKNINVGTNWLKGAKGRISTPDYYSYDSSASDNMTNLRKFFAGNEEIFYKPEYSTTTQTVDAMTYKRYRDSILNTFCDESGYTGCKKCPNNAKIMASTKSYNIDGITWDVHTIADCYMDEFSDHSGTYVYNKNDNQNAAKQKCYYSNDVKGDELVSE